MFRMFHSKVIGYLILVISSSHLLMYLPLCSMRAFLLFFASRNVLNDFLRLWFRCLIGLHALLFFCARFFTMEKEVFTHQTRCFCCCVYHGTSWSKGLLSDTWTNHEIHNIPPAWWKKDEKVGTSKRAIPKLPSPINISSTAKWLLFVSAWSLETWLFFGTFV